MGGDDKTNSRISKDDEEKGEYGKSTTSATRIFIGGLGATVTTEDLRNTFSSLGKLDSVEIVRTKGRSIAYFDFLPSSEKSLPKLFSTYNGCLWKGGRLRLEKAKDHYVHRLRQEQEEDAKLANSAPSNVVGPTKNTGSPEKFNSVLRSDKMEIRVFFPKLKKVKVLPLGGTGKHKYSFQRIEVPTLPIHFCDCEEHSDLYDTAKGKELSALDTAKGKDFCTHDALGGGIDEKELSMMNSVLNKLLEKESTSKVACSGDGLVKEADNAPKSVDDLLVDENETDQMTDEDNLVMNMVAGGKSRTALLRNQERDFFLANEEAIVNELRTSKDKSFESMLKSTRKKIVTSDKKRKSPLIEETGGNEMVSAKKIHLHEPAHARERKSWLQKSTWRDLAGERGSASFSISQIMQSTAPTGEESSRDDVNVSYFSERQNQNLVKDINLESQSGLSKEPKEHAVIEPTKINAALNESLPKEVYVSESNQPKAEANESEPKEVAISHSNEPNAALNRSDRGAFWQHKSSWTQLVGETSSSFSISQLLPGMSFEKQEQVEPKSLDAQNSNASECSKSGGTGIYGDGSNPSTVGGEDILVTPDSSTTVALATGLDPDWSRPQRNLRPSEQNDEIAEPKPKHAAPAGPSDRNCTIGETCSFMRSAASMKEWMKAKASLSGSLKKKTNEKEPNSHGS